MQSPPPVKFLSPQTKNKGVREDAQGSVEQDGRTEDKTKVTPQQVK